MMFILIEEKEGEAKKVETGKKKMFKRDGVSLMSVKKNKVVLVVVVCTTPNGRSTS